MQGGSKTICHTPQSPWKSAVRRVSPSKLVPESISPSSSCTVASAQLSSSGTTPKVSRANVVPSTSNTRSSSVPSSSNTSSASSQDSSPVVSSETCPPS